MYLKYICHNLFAIKKIKIKVNIREIKLKKKIEKTMNQIILKLINLFILNYFENSKL